ncbi:MAG: hypothetical protein NT090_16585 [Acidobacteria bacterium]|nr:hypothetical protein [Acidobacteriota bacterium]
MENVGLWRAARRAWMKRPGLGGIAHACLAQLFFPATAGAAPGAGFPRCGWRAARERMPILYRLMLVDRVHL